MKEAKRYDAVHLRYEDSNIRYGEGCEVEVVAAYDFDTLAQRLQEAERLRDRMSSLLRSIRRHNSSGLTRDTQEEIDAFLAGKGCKP